jgi:hypothetical protein
VAELAPQLPDTRLVYVADRECDIHAFMVKARHLGHPADWLIRATHNRCTDSDQKLWNRLGEAPALGEVSFTLPAAPGRSARVVRQTLRVEQVSLQPARGAAVERSPPCWRAKTLHRRVSSRWYGGCSPTVRSTPWKRPWR